MIRIEHAFLLAALLLPACERHGGKLESNATVESSRSSNAAGQQAQPPAKPSAPVEPTEAPSAAVAELSEVVREKKDILVNGEPACALSVKYRDALEQPVTWRGESCAKLVVRLSSIEDLKRIGQDTKLDGETREDLARMPGRRALYLEGAHSSSLYPQNVMHRVYEVPLAD